MPITLTISQPLRPGRDDLQVDFPGLATIELGDDAPADGDVDVLLEAFGQEDVTATPRVAFWSERLTITGAPLALRFGTPDEAQALRFRARVTRPDGAALGEALWPASGTSRVVTDRGRPVAVSYPVPSIFRFLQQLDPEPSSGSGVAGVVAHVAAQLDRDLEALLDRDDYPAAFPDEVDEADAPATRLAAWQKAAIVHLSGGFYTMSPRRWLQWLDDGVGYSPVCVCNNLVDTFLWLRGAFDHDDLTAGTSNPDSTSAQNAHEWLQARCRAEASRGAVFDDWKDAPEGTRRRATVRPGSIFLLEGHINVVLRVRRAGRHGRRFQLFDTGGIRPPGLPAPGVGTTFNVLQEENWMTVVPENATAHAYLPLREDRTLPPWPLHRPVPTNEGRFRYLREDQHAPGSEDVAGEGTGLLVPAGTDRAARLRADARAPAAILMVLDRATDEVLYTSRPLALHRPLTALFGSVVQVPDPRRHEARWFVRLAGNWEHGADATQAHGRQYHVVLEVYNDEDGVARLWRMDMHEDEVARGDRGRFLSRHQLLTEARRRPTARTPDEQPLDRVLADALERAGGPPIAEDPTPP